ncbi:hypothetical protein MIND_00306800 [Mycena indigotica]|uniref:Secreted protein n=1 Tax=Mycena indigotica TaxID=2126181 RepID=A0A8H6WAP4_9AGAR|nr:uncharacterized protein MIND_00306800 [Mycena indigotica]KAF7309361.1 hypothetical protein MIND_00306800 [Mycena indigotica]
MPLVKAAVIPWRWPVILLLDLHSGQSLQPLPPVLQFLHATPLWDRVRKHAQPSLCLRQLLECGINIHA